MPSLSLDEFAALVRGARASEPGGSSPALVVPLSVRLLADQLTPVLAYRRLVAPDERTAPSFLLESVEGGERQGRHSILSSQPAMELVAYGADLRVVRRRSISGLNSAPAGRATDPLLALREMAANLRLVLPPARRGGVNLPACFLGGWV